MSATTIYTRADLRLIAFQVAELYRPPTSMVLEQIEIESGFRNDLVSSTGCVGFCQIDPRYCHKPGYGILPCADPLNPRDAVAYLCSFLMAGHAKFNSWSAAQLAYNVGMAGDLTKASLAYKRLAAATRMLTE